MKWGHWGQRGRCGWLEQGHLAVLMPLAVWVWWFGGLVTIWPHAARSRPRPRPALRPALRPDMTVSESLSVRLLQRPWFTVPSRRLNPASPRRLIPTSQHLDPTGQVFGWLFGHQVRRSTIAAAEPN